MLLLKYQGINVNTEEIFIIQGGNIALSEDLELEVDRCPMFQP